jgi:fatty acid desaturase
MLRYRSDIRTLLWAFVLFPATALVQYARPELAGWMLPIGLYFGFCAGVLSHNQNHCPTFTTKRMNAFYAAWLSAFYGYPTFAWIPTHNLNHHRFVNRAGDATITWRYSKRNIWTVAWTYFFVSAYWQAEPIKQYIRMARERQPDLFRRIVGQYLTVGLAHAGLLALAIALHGPKLGVWVYFCAFFVPATFALWSMMFINYIQHVDCDPWSKHNHSRNFVGKLGNWLVFNNGLHTVHHENAGMHWSLARAAHEKIEDLIDPELRQTSIIWFSIKSYLLGILLPRFRTKQVGRAAYDPPSGAARSIKTSTEEVAAVDAGTNEAMA